MNNAVTRALSWPTRRMRRQRRSVQTMFKLGPAVRSLRNVDTYYEHYAKNEIVNAAVCETTRALLGIPFMTESWDDGRQRWGSVSATHRLNRLLAYPHPALDPAALFDRFWTDCVVTGNGILWKQRNELGEVVALWPVDPRYVGIETDRRKLIKSYVLTDEALGTGEALASSMSVFSSKATRYAPEDIIHMRMAPDPDFPLWGLSPISSALDSIDADNAVGQFILQFFQNGAVPAFLFTSSVELTDDEIERLKARWQQRQAGTERAWSLAIIDGTQGKLDRLGLATGSREIGLHDLRADIEARILAPLNVPPIVVGAVIGIQHATYSNYRQAREALLEENTGPMLLRAASVFTFGLAREFAAQGELLRVVADTSNVLALEEARASKSGRIVSELANSARMRNEARIALGLPPTEDGDKFLRPLNMELEGATVEGDSVLATRTISRGRTRRLARLIAAGENRAKLREVYDEQIRASQAYLAELLDVREDDESVRMWAHSEAELLPLKAPGESATQSARRILFSIHRIATKAVAQVLPPESV